jgi:hypothetical protein
MHSMPAEKEENFFEKCAAPKEELFLKKMK